MVATEVIDNMTDDQFLHLAFDVLSRELGLYGYARFLRLYRPGTGDYTRDRHQWLDNLSIDDILAQVKASSK